MKLKMILFFLLVLLSIAGVSAADADNMTVQTSDDALDSVVAVDEVNDQYTVDKSNDDVLNASFNDLQTLIDNAYLGAQISLDKDYSLADGGNTLKISKSITIDGKGHTLNGANKNTIILIETSGGDEKVILKDIKFVNGKAAKNGGAILNTQSATSLTLINCEFKENNADCGGAVYSDGNVYVTGSTFDSNHVNEDAGAIYCKGESQINSSKFNNNDASLAIERCYGGAIRSVGVCYIDSCEFNGNSAGFGGAVYADNKLTITGKNKFTNNKCRAHGCAIFASKDVYINWNGNANNSLCEMVSNSYYSKPSFYGNLPDLDGGAIYAKGNLFAKSLKCDKNEVEHLGGAVYCEGETHIISSKFSNNDANYDQDRINHYGGAVYSEGACYIESCTFDGNKAYNFGGAIYTGHDLTIKNSNFTNNQAKFFDFTTSFNYQGGAVYCSGNLNIVNSFFKDNLAGTDGGAIYCKGVTSISNSEFNSNKASEDIYQRSYGGAIRSEKAITVDSCSFYNNNAEDWGGAIYTDKDAKITNSKFSHCWAKNAGAVYASTITNTVTNSEFTNCSATDGDGGAVYINNECKSEFVSCRFECDESTNRGGAIYIDSYKSGSRLKVSYCTFVDNTAGKKGQSVYNSGYYDLIDKCWFGTNSPNFKDQFKIYKVFTSDKDQDVTNYLKIEMKVSDENNLYVGNPYKVTIHFKDLKGNSLDKNLYHSAGTFYGDGNFSNVNAYKNDITADVVFSKEQPKIYGKLDHQTLSLSPSVKKQSDVVKINSCDDVSYPDDVVVKYHIDYQTNATYVIKDSKGEVVQQGDVANDSDEMLVVKGLVPDRYSITIENPETFYSLQSSANASFNVKKAINNVSVNVENVDYGDPTVIIIIADVDGNYTVDINGTAITVIVNNGTGNNSIELHWGIYYANVTFDNKNYDTRSKNTTFEVYTPGAGIPLPADVKITAKAKTFKTTDKNKKYTVTLKADGKALKNKKVTLKVNGKTYKATTNSKGKATFKLSKLTKKGAYNAVITYKGDDQYNKATKKVKIKVKDGFETIAKGSKKKSMVKKIQRALKSNGYYLRYDGHYLMVDGIFWDCTQRAVKQFQAANNLKVTGKVDEKTALKLKII